jgi:hypothetical protein
MRTFSLSCAVLLQIVMTGLCAYAGSPLSGFNPADIDPGSKGTSIHATTFWADNVFTLEAILRNKWKGDYTPSDDNTANAYWYACADITWYGWRIAGFNRGELFMDANRDTVDILHLVKTKQDLPVGRRFDIDLSCEGFEASGVEVSKKLDLGLLADGLDAGFTGRLLGADRVQHGTVRGILAPTGTKTYDFNLDVNYVYDKNLLYSRDNSPPSSGNGYSFDLGAAYRWNESLCVSVLARDLLGRIYWKDAPYTDAKAVSDVTYYDDDGYQLFRPTIEGYESYKDFTQRIPFKTDVDVTYARGPVKISSTVNIIENNPYYWFNAEYALKESLSISAGYNVNYRIFSAGAAYKYFQLYAYTDNVSVDRVKALGLSVSFGVAW